MPKTKDEIESWKFSIIKILALKIEMLNRMQSLVYLLL